MKAIVFSIEKDEYLNRALEQGSVRTNLTFHKQVGAKVGVEITSTATMQAQVLGWIIRSKREFKCVSWLDLLQIACISILGCAKR